VRTTYCSAKHAIQGFFGVLRAEEFEQGSGSRITNFCPGSVITNMARNAVGSKVGQLRGQSESNIEVGLDPVWVCKQNLAAAHSNVDELWMAVRKEMVFLLMAQYLLRPPRVCCARSSKV